MTTHFDFRSAKTLYSLKFQFYFNQTGLKRVVAQLKSKTKSTNALCQHLNELLTIVIQI